MTTVSDANLGSIDNRGWFVLFMLAFSGGSFDPTELRRYWVEMGGRATVEEMSRCCQQLARMGAISCVYKYSKAEHNRYAMTPCLDRGALVSLLARSVSSNWWRVFDLNSNTGLPLPDQKGYFPGGGMTLQYHQKEAVVLRALIDASGLQADFGSFYDPGDVQWEGVRALARVMSPGSGWKWPTAPFGSSNPLALHLRLVSFLFVRGFDLRSTVAGLLADISAARFHLRDAELCEVASLAVLMGIDADWSAAKGWELSPEALVFAGIGTSLRSGDLAAVHKLCTAAFKAVPALSSLDAPAFNVLAALVSAFAKPSSSRLLQHLRILCPSMSYKYNDRSSGERGIVDDRNREMRGYSILTTGYALPTQVAESRTFVGNLAWPLDALVNGMKKDAASAVAEPLLASAEAAFARGYPTLAGVYLSVFGWALPESCRASATALATRISDAHGVWFRPFDAAPSEWKRILGVLSERLPKAVAAKSAPAAKVKTGRLVWELAIAPSPDGNLFCGWIAPRFRGARAADDGTDDKPVTLKSVYGGKYDDCLSEADKSAVAALNKVGYTGPRGTVAVPAAAIEALCGQDNLTSFYDDGLTRNQKTTATSLVRQDVPVVGKPGADGAMRLTVPIWSVGATRAYAIRETGEQAYAYYPIGRDVRNVLDVFRDFGSDGSIELPQEALATAKPVFRRLATVLPLQGTLADVAGGEGTDGMTRHKGDPTPLVRLSLEEMRLHVSLRVRPIPSASGVLFEPGAGQPERTLKLAKGPVILVRDLAAEKDRAAAVEKALSAFEGERDGACEWQIDEAASALEALAEIHALGDAAHVEWQPGRKVSVSRPAAHPSLEASLGADEWFAVSGDWQLDDGRLVSFAKLLENFDRRVGRFVPLDEKGYLALNRALLRQLEALRAAGQVRKDTVVVSPAALPMLDGAFAAEEADALKLPKAMSVAADRIRAAFAATPPVPGTFKGAMRPYQEEGYRWLSRLCDCGIGCCLADDMGLGKTIQLIALLAAKKAAGPSLVVAPASVAFNWRNELERFAPSLRVALVGQTPGAGEEDVARFAKTHDVVVTSYGVASSRLKAFADVAWNVLVLDEAQAIKNHLTQRAKSVKELKARFRVAATGTPVENRLTELWSIFDFLNPGMLGGETRFAKELAPHGEATPRLKRLVKPLILRRIKRDVLTDLPEKEEITVPVVLGDEERHAYEATRLSALAKLEDGERENKLAILAELTRLRRFCCHPSLVMPSVQVGAKLEALERLLAGLKENGHRALVFSQYVDFLAIVRAMLGRNGWTCQYLDGATPKGEREKSVAAFQDGEGDFFLISLKAGGMGLNLTAANYVILLDPWWNPAVENQAADRVHRIGQRLPVTVYRLIAQDTIEEKVVNLHAKKTALAEDILASGASSLTAEAMLGLLTS